MARTTATNFSGGLQFPYATAATDLFVKDDVQILAQAVDQHDHSVGKGLSVSAAIANASITNAKLGPDTARANLLTNGGFEIWQRGNGPFSGNPGYAADQWWTNPAGVGTVSASRDTANVDSSSLACAVVTVSAATGQTFFSQKIEGYGQLAGKTLSFSCRVRTSVPNSARLQLFQTSGPTYGAYHSGGGTYETLTVTVAIAANTTIVQCNVAFATNGTYYLDNAMLVVGTVPADYAPLHPADDLARCLRYYEVTGGYSSACFSRGYLAAGANLPWIWQFRATKPVIPTVTKVGTWSVGNCAQPTVINSGNGSSAPIGAIATAAGTDTFFFCTDATNYLTCEANP